MNLIPLYRDRRKYNSLVDNIVQRGLLHDFIRGLDTFDIVSNNLILAPKVPRYSYSILSNKITPKKSFEFWEDLLDDPPYVKILNGRKSTLGILNVQLKLG